MVVGTWLKIFLSFFGWDLLEGWELLYIQKHMICQLCGILGFLLGWKKDPYRMRNVLALDGMMAREAEQKGVAGRPIKSGSTRFLSKPETAGRKPSPETTRCFTIRASG